MTAPKAPIRHAIEELNAYAGDVRRASHHTVNNAVRRYVARLDAEPLALIVRAVLPAANFDSWFATARGTIGSMVGSGKLDWPATTPERIALQAELLRRIAAGGIDLIGYTYDFHYIENKFDTNIAEFITQDFEPFHRDVSRLLSVELDAREHTQPAVSLPLPERAQATAVDGKRFGVSYTTKGAHVVLLVHGIRTTASWAEMVARVLTEETDLVVIPVRYGVLDLISFLLPGPTRRRPIARVLREVRIAAAEYRNSDISVLAHSFGTYAIARILAEEGDIRFRHVVFCGSIVRSDYRWDLVRGRIGSRPVNDCGAKDIWPLFASAATWGYGPSGVFGFGSVIVTDRFHPLAHSDYFDEGFARQYWRRLFTDDVVVPSEWERSRPTTPFWQTVLAKVPVRWVFAVAIVLLLALAGKDVLLRFEGSRPRPDPQGPSNSAAVQQAWQVLVAAQGKPGDLGRSAALRTLIQTGERLKDIDLDGAVLRGTQLTRGYFEGATFRHAFLAEAHLDTAVLRNADLSGAQMAGASLRCADLYNAKLHGTQAALTHFDDAVMPLVELDSSWLRNSSLDSAYLREARLTNADLAGASLRYALLRAAVLRGANLSGADLTGADLSGAILGNNETLRTIGSLRGANVADVHEAPPWFERWAVDTMGAHVTRTRLPDFPSRCRLE